MAGSQAKTYTVTFQGASAGRPKYTSHTDTVSSTRFPVGEPVHDVSQAAVKRLESIPRLSFKVAEQKTQKEA